LLTNSRIQFDTISHSIMASSYGHVKAMSLGREGIGVSKQIVVMD
jgi:hypothetical protein